MTRQEYNQAVISIVELITANNPGGVARALKSAGYNSSQYIAESDLKVALLQLHATNPEKFYEVLSQVEWNMGKNNWTNDPQYRDPIINSITSQAGVDVSTERGGFWGTVVGVLGQIFLPQVQTPYTPPPEEKTPWGVYIIAGLSLIAVIVVLYFGLKFLTPAK